MRSDSHWAAEFRRQRTYRLEQSATSTTFARSGTEHLQTGTEDASLLIRPATLSRFRDFAAAYKSADLLTYFQAGGIGHPAQRLPVESAALGSAWH